MTLAKSILLSALLPLTPFAQAPWDDGLLRPYVMNHRAAKSSPADLSFLHDAPAGKDGFVKISGGHLTKANGQRIRFWGVHLTDWSRGSVELPPKEDAPMWAATLARFGVNLVRLHFLDLAAPRGIVDASKGDTRSFDAPQLDRLDFMVSELKKRGIYMDLNLNVGRTYRAGDGVTDFDRIQSAKGMTLYDPRLIELEKEYARKLLTHLNPYTGTEYRNEPAIAIVEIVNENGIYQGFTSRSKYYDDELTALYNTWLRRLPAERLAKLRELAGVAGDAPVPRLRGSETAKAPKERYQTEMEFFMDLENGFYQDMTAYLRSLGVKVPIIGTADHSHSSSGFPMLASLSKLDIVDGHVYWQHPGTPPPTNTPMVNDPLNSTVVQLSRSAFAGKPYTVSETNHPFPNDWASEGIPIIASYAAFQDWDAVVMYTFEPKLSPDWKPYVGDPFDISLDPVRMTEMATGALAFLRGDVKPARETVSRTYSKDQTIESRRLPAGEQPYFTPGFPLSLPLRHAVRIQAFDGPPTARLTVPEANPIVSDTGQLAWYTSPEKSGMVTVETDRTQALIGFIKANRRNLKNLSADIANQFATITLCSMETKPIAQAGKLLLTAGSRVSNTNMKWNETRTKAQGGESPSLIEPVTGSITFKNLAGAKSVTAVALDGSGEPIGGIIEAAKSGQGWVLPVGHPATPWYVVTVHR